MSSPTGRRNAAWRVRPVRPGDRPALEALFTRLSEQTVRLRFFARLQAFPAPYLAAVLACRPEVHDAVVAYADVAYADPDTDASWPDVSGDVAWDVPADVSQSQGPAAQRVPGPGPGGPVLIGLASLAAVPVSRDVPGEAASLAAPAASAASAVVAGRQQDGPSRTRPDLAELGVVVADPWQRQGAGTAMSAALLARARTRAVTGIVATVLPGRSALLTVTARHLPLVPRAHARDPYGLTAVYKLDGAPAQATADRGGRR